MRSNIVFFDHSKLQHDNNNNKKNPILKNDCSQGVYDLLQLHVSQ